MLRLLTPLVLLLASCVDSPSYGTPSLSCPEQYDRCLLSAGPDPSKIALCRCANEARTCLGQDAASCE